jgi:glutathione synthase/RimK-type ligase-like ATP-grasp enzyme
MSREKGYLYFQDFVPGNAFDTRVFVVGEKAVALRRSVRKNDFRASGSGMPDYRREAIDERCVASAWTVSQRLGTQALACDYIFQDNEIRVVEISYGSPARLYDGCPGYWDRNMVWHDAAVAAEDLIMEMFLERLAGGQTGTAQ